MKVFVRIIVSFALCIPYLLLWYFVAMMATIGNFEGHLSVFEDAFGEWIVLLGWLTAIIVFLSMIYLRFFVKNEWLVHIIAYAMTAIFLICSVSLFNLGNSKFKEFTTEKWLQYPQRRITMYFDLAGRYSIQGYSVSAIKELLGEPDEIMADDIYVYNDRHGNAIYVRFQDGKALDLSYVE